jgi:hypothetical protein
MKKKGGQEVIGRTGRKAVMKEKENSLTNTQQSITQVFNSMRDVVIEKNRRYGDAALAPKQIFSKLDAGEGIKVRIDDKISRIMNNGGTVRKNDVADLIGYLALLSVSQNWLDFSDLID